MARRKLSKYEIEVHDTTKLLHDVIFDQNYKFGYYERLYSLAVSRTFTRKDWNAVLCSIAWTHNIDITRIDVNSIYEMVMEPEMG